MMRFSIFMAALVVGSTMAAAQTPPAPAPATGDAARGRQLYESSLRCYACHGYDGQTGSPRLVPMARPQEAFLAYVRKPSAGACRRLSRRPSAT